LPSKIASDGVDVGAGVGQQARQVEGAVAGGEHQRRQPAAGELLDLLLGAAGNRRAPLETAAVGGGDVVRPRVDVGAGGNQQPSGLDVPLGHGPHQRRGATPALFRVDVGARFEQQADGVGLSGSRCEHERGVARGGERCVRIRARFDQPAEHGGAAVDGGQLQRHHTFSRPRTHTCAGRQQKLRQLHIVVLDGPMKRRGAVDLRGVDVGLAGKRGADRFAIAAHRGVRDCRRRCRLGGAAGQENEDDETHETHHRVTLSKAGAAA
jgi:hypothetical protein